MEGLRLVPMEVQLEEWERDQPDFGVLCNEANSIVDSLEVRWVGYEVGGA